MGFILIFNRSRQFYGPFRGTNKPKELAYNMYYRILPVTQKIPITPYTQTLTHTTYMIYVYIYMGVQPNAK